jgi:hypothetical protein
MKVRCIRLEDVNGNEVASSFWLELGRIYTVLSVEVYADSVLLRVDTGDRDKVALHPVRVFEVIDNSIAPTWRVHLRTPLLSLEPEAWAREGFWEEFFDGDSEPGRVFEEERMKIISGE